MLALGALGALVSQFSRCSCTGRKGQQGEERERVRATCLHRPSGWARGGYHPERCWKKLWMPRPCPSLTKSESRIARRKVKSAVWSLARLGTHWIRRIGPALNKWQRTKKGKFGSQCWLSPSSEATTFLQFTLYIPFVSRRHARPVYACAHIHKHTHKRLVPHPWLTPSGALSQGPSSISLPSHPDQPTL